jgi:hypothetical protein
MNRGTYLDHKSSALQADEQLFTEVVVQIIYLV